MRPGELALADAGAADRATCSLSQSPPPAKRSSTSAQRSPGQHPTPAASHAPDKEDAAILAGLTSGTALQVQMHQLERCSAPHEALVNTAAERISTPSNAALRTFTAPQAHSSVDSQAATLSDAAAQQHCAERVVSSADSTRGARRSKNVTRISSSARAASEAFHIPVHWPSGCAAISSSAAAVATLVPSQMWRQSRAPTPQDYELGVAVDEAFDPDKGRRTTGFTDMWSNAFSHVHGSVHGYSDETKKPRSRGLPILTWRSTDLDADKPRLDSR